MHKQFAQFDNLIFAADGANGVHALTVGSATTFNAISIGAAPAVIGVVNRFLIVGSFPNGDTQNSASIRWSAIDDPTNFPTPGSATAIASQAGDQFFDPSKGVITRILGADQFGLVFQSAAVNRLTYVGGSVVFQIDRIDDKHGAFFPNAVVSVLPRVFFISSSGFFVTDGVGTKEIGRSRISKTFFAEVVTTNPYRVFGAYDARFNLDRKSVV